MNALDVEHLLEMRYSQPDYMFMSQVRNSTGFVAELRTADGIAMSMYPSRKFEVAGFEIKVNRSDWLNELKNPAKTDELFKYCDKLWIVAPKEVVEVEELPKGWGFMIVQKNGLRTKVQAEYIESTEIDRGFIASMLRRCMDNMILRSTVDNRVRAAEKTGAESNSHQIRSLKDDLKKYRTANDIFRGMTGVDISGWNCIDDAHEVGKLIKRIKAGEKFDLGFEFREIERHLEDALESTKAAENIFNAKSCP